MRVRAPWRPFFDTLVNLSQRWVQPREQTLRVRGLSGPVEIFTDRYGVPSIFADTRDDLFFAQGYVTARDRLFQMDYNRHGARGRLCELVGRRPVPWRGLTVHLENRTTFDVDVLLRTFGLEASAKLSLEVCSDEARQILEAYTAGVNAYLATHPTTLEHRLLRHRPQPWTALDSVVMIKAIAFELNYAWRAILMGGMLADAQVPEALRHALWPHVPEGGTTITEHFGPVAQNLAQTALAASAVTWGPGRPGAGSNCYAVAASHTAEGQAMLANDTHLTLTAPVPWHEVRLCGGGFDLRGFALTGVPGVGIGRNADVAWGITAGLVHDLDLFIEELDPEDPTRYRTPEGWSTLEVREEIFSVRGEPDVVIPISTSRHGPLLTTVGPDLGGRRRLAICWTGHRPSSELDALLGVWRSQDYASFNEALRHHGCPTFNMTFAGRGGDVGYVLAGTVPKRKMNTPLRPLEGWTGEWDWDGIVPFDENPREHSPPRGFVVTANTRVGPWSYPHELGHLFEPPDRHDRIVAELTARGKAITMDDLVRLQSDTYAGWAVTFRDLVLERLGGVDMLVDPEQRRRDPSLGDIAHRLAEWNGHADADSPGAAVVYTLAYTFGRTLVAEVAGETAAWAFIELSTLAGPPLLDILRTPSLLAGTSIDLHALLRRSFIETVYRCRRDLGRDVTRWRWGSLHPLWCRHRLHDTPLGALFSLGPEPAPGGPDTVNRGDFNANNDYACTLGPAMRWVAPAASPNGNYSVVPGGQSGHRFSRHYDDQLPLFLRGLLKAAPMDRLATELAPGVERRERWEPFP